MKELDKEVLYETINNLSQQVAMLSVDKAVLLAQLNLLKKEDERYFREALICLDMGLNPKDMRIEEQVALNYASDFVVERQAELKKDFHFLSEEIVDAYRYGKEDRFIQSTAIKESNDIESNDIEGLNQKNKDSWER